MSNEPLDMEAIKSSWAATCGDAEKAETAEMMIPALIAEVERQSALLKAVTDQINKLAWFTAFDPAKKLWQVSDEHSIGEQIERLRKFANQKPKRDQ